MSEEAAFLEALKANPADDTVRLVYADWLDEHNDSRSQYVRLVCSLAWTPQEEILKSPEANELRTLSLSVNPEWEKVVGGRFEFTLLEFSPAHRDLLAVAVRRILKLSETSATDLRLAEAMVATAPTALRSRLTCPAATALQRQWVCDYAGWFPAAALVAVRPIPNPAHSASGLFDVVLQKLPYNFWLNWPSNFKTPVSTLLNLPTRQAADRLRVLPSTLFRALRFPELEMTLRRTRKAFNQPYCSLLPCDALTVVPHIADVPQSVAT